MNLENQQGKQAISDRSSPKRLPMSMQEDLVRRAILSGLLDTEWVKDNSAKFRELIEKEPDLFEKYLKNSETTLAYIEKKLKKETLH